MSPSLPLRHQRVRVAPLARLAPGATLAVAVAGVPIALFSAAGHVHAYRDTCLRCCGSLAAGTREGGTVRCACGWRYDVATGEVGGVPRLAVDRLGVDVREGEVFVDLPIPTPATAGR